MVVIGQCKKMNLESSLLGLSKSTLENIAGAGG
jgi:hypothetical protein